MSDNQTRPRTPLPHPAVVRPPTLRYLYFIVSALLFVLMLVGFQMFYLRGQGFPGHPLFPPVRTVLVAHGLAMTGWMVLLVVQTLLIAGNNRRAHISLGIVGAALAAGIVVLGLWTALATARLEPEVVLWGLNRRHFMAIPLSSILMFAGFTAVGLWNRRRTEIHRPMMLLATLAVIGAATDRIAGLPASYAPTFWGRWFGPFFVALVIGALFLAAKSALTRTFDRWLAGGLALFAAFSAGAMRLAPTSAWESLTKLLIG